jgi:hypothetical protein
MELLKLIALDDDDLKVVSAHLQDAISRVEDMAFLSRERRFVMLLNRFDWARAAEDAASNGQGYQRRRCALRFEKVHKAQVRQISLDDRAGVLELLAVHFESGDAPSGYITLTFAGGGAVRLHVDCIEAELSDLGPVWKTPRKPEHPRA